MARPDEKMIMEDGNGRHGCFFSALAKKIGLGRKPEPAKSARAPRKGATKKPAAKKG